MPSQMGMGIPTAVAVPFGGTGSTMGGIQVPIGGGMPSQMGMGIRTAVAVPFASGGMAFAALGGMAFAAEPADGATPKTAGSASRLASTASATSLSGNASTVVASANEADATAGLGTVRKRLLPSDSTEELRSAAEAAEAVAMAAAEEAEEAVAVARAAQENLVRMAAAARPEVLERCANIFGPRAFGGFAAPAELPVVGDSATALPIAPSADVSSLAEHGAHVEGVAHEMGGKEVQEEEAHPEPSAGGNGGGGYGNVSDDGGACAGGAVGVNALDAAKTEKAELARASALSYKSQATAASRQGKQRIGVLSSSSGTASSGTATRPSGAPALGAATTSVAHNGRTLDSDSDEGGGKEEQVLQGALSLSLMEQEHGALGASGSVSCTARGRADSEVVVLSEDVGGEGDDGIDGSGGDGDGGVGGGGCGSAAVASASAESQADLAFFASPSALPSLVASEYSVASTILRSRVRTGKTDASPFQIEKLLDEQLLREITDRDVSHSELALCNPMVEEFLLAISGSHVGISNFVSEHVIAQLQAEIATLRMIENSAEAADEASRVTTIVNDAVPLHLTDDRSTLSLLLVDYKMITLAFRGGDGGVDECGKSKPVPKTVGRGGAVKHAHLLNALSIYLRRKLVEMGQKPSAIDALISLEDDDVWALILARTLGAWQQTDCPVRGHRFKGTALEPLHAGLWKTNLGANLSLKRSEFSVCERLFVSVSGTSPVSDIAAFFGLAGPTVLADAYTQTFNDLLVTKQHGTILIANGVSSPWFLYSLASGCRIHSFVQAQSAEDAEALGKTRDSFKGSPSATLAIKRTFSRRDTQATWLGHALSRVDLIAFHLAGRIPALMLMVHPVPSVDNLGTINNEGGIHGRKYRPRPGACADGGHLVALFPRDAAGEAAALSFWKRCHEYGDVLYKILSGKLRFEQLDGWRKIDARDAVISTIENCEIALIDGWEELHGPSWTNLTPNELQEPFRDVLDELVSAPLKQPALFPRCVSRVSCALSRD